MRINGVLLGKLLHYVMPVKALTFLGSVLEKRNQIVYKRSEKSDLIELILEYHKGRFWDRYCIVG